MTIKECNHYWCITKNIGMLSICYKIDKELCTTKEDLTQYIKSNKLF